MGKTIRLTPTARPSYKYNINHQIGLLPFKRNLIQQIIDHLAKSGITRNEFYSDRAIPFGSDKSIPSDRLMIYAKVFECAIQDLVNHKVNADSIRDVMIPKRKRVKHGL